MPDPILNGDFHDKHVLAWSVGVTLGRRTAKTSCMTLPRAEPVTC